MELGAEPKVCSRTPFLGRSGSAGGVRTHPRPSLGPGVCGFHPLLGWVWGCAQIPKGIEWNDILGELCEILEILGKPGR